MTIIQVTDDWVAGYSSMIAAFFKWVVGKKDEAKVQLRDNIRKDVLELMAFSRATITVAPGTPDEDMYYLVVINKEITDSGTGLVRPGTVKVSVDSYDTLEKITSSRMGLGEALKAEKVEYKGVGVIKGLTFKVAEWLSKYVT